MPLSPCQHVHCTINVHLLIVVRYVYVIPISHYFALHFIRDQLPHWNQCEHIFTVQPSYCNPAEDKSSSPQSVFLWNKRQPWVEFFHKQSYSVVWNVATLGKILCMQYAGQYRQYGNTECVCYLHGISTLLVDQKRWSVWWQPILILPSRRWRVFSVRTTCSYEPL